MPDACPTLRCAAWVLWEQAAWVLKPPHRTSAARACFRAGTYAASGAGSLPASIPAASQLWPLARHVFPAPPRGAPVPLTRQGAPAGRKRLQHRAPVIQLCKPGRNPETAHTVMHGARSPASQEPSGGNSHLSSGFDLTKGTMTTDRKLANICGLTPGNFARLSKKSSPSGVHQLKPLPLCHPHRADAAATSCAEGVTLTNQGKSSVSALQR
mmetsp:Transcript_18990/g.51621  ORF Transcript_18990/g.51621 Transcript_18990/m.51621 type:complete len:212 (+) Transcript_18990:293-928(+)